MKILSNLIKAITQPAQNNQTFIQLFREFNTRDALENKHSKETIKKYRNFCDNLETFLKSMEKETITADQFTMALVDDFKHWLHQSLTTCGCTHSAKHINRCQKVMDYAVRRGQLKFNHIAAFKVKRDPVKEVIHLENNEFLTWTKAIWQNKPYQVTQILYKFQIITGISYGDLFNYKTVTDEHGRIWIESKRGKRGKPFYVPLWHWEFKEALDMHLEYNGKLPFLHNHSYNRYLKEMAAILGIEKDLTTHTGRKTFATIKDQNGWDLGAISAVLGNTEEICRKHYIKPGKKKIETQLSKQDLNPLKIAA